MERIAPSKANLPSGQRRRMKPKEKYMESTPAIMLRADACFSKSKSGSDQVRCWIDGRARNER
jgi:hypothetical protein